MDLPLLPEEEGLPETCLVLRILYQYLSLFNRLDFYYPDFFNKMKNSGIKLPEVLSYIAKKTSSQDQLIVIHIDETQVI